MALLAWSEPLAAAPSAAAADRTTTLSPTFSPLTTCVVESPTTPVCTRSVRLGAVGGLHGDRRAAERLRGDGHARDLRGDDVGRGAHAGLEALARLVEAQRHRVADGAGARARGRRRREDADVGHPGRELLARRGVDGDRGRLADLDRADVGLAEGDLHLEAADLRERDEARAAEALDELELAPPPPRPPATLAPSEPLEDDDEEDDGGEPPLTVWPTEPLTAVTVPAIGARRVVAATAFSALWTLSCALSTLAWAAATVIVLVAPEPELDPELTGARALDPLDCAGVVVAGALGLDERVLGGLQVGLGLGEVDVGGGRDRPWPGCRPWRRAGPP